MSMTTPRTLEYLNTQSNLAFLDDLTSRDFRLDAIKTAAAVAAELKIHWIYLCPRGTEPKNLQELNDQMPVIQRGDDSSPTGVVMRRPTPDSPLTIVKDGVVMRRPTPDSPLTIVEEYRVPVAKMSEPLPTTVWGPSGNYLFRANHELLHYLHQEEFNKSGEWHIAKEEIKRYRRHAPARNRDRIVKLVEAETWGQTGFFELTEGYPLDQVAFFEAYARTGNPKDATARYLDQGGQIAKPQ